MQPSDGRSGRAAYNRRRPHREKRSSANAHTPPVTERTSPPAGKGLLKDGWRLLAHSLRVLESTCAAGAAPAEGGFYGSAASALLPEVLRASGEQRPSFDFLDRRATDRSTSHSPAFCPAGLRPT
ncbi:MAG: hypothetical protein C5B48_11495 [Candidatus Rokuibacteriota bacterium]|nr:MAG: hypothetical protein C5B48_11495 [Candidatus Rokubacteria bacterium]